MKINSGTSYVSKEDKERIQNQFSKAEMDRYNLAGFVEVIKNIECPVCHSHTPIVKTGNYKFRCTTCKITFKIYLTTIIDEEYTASNEIIDINASPSHKALTTGKDELTELADLVGQLRKDLKNKRARDKYIPTLAYLPETVQEAINTGVIEDLTKADATILSRYIKSEGGVLTKNGRRWPRPQQCSGPIPWNLLNEEEILHIKSTYGKNRWRVEVDRAFSLKKNAGYWDSMGIKFIEREEE